MSEMNKELQKLDALFSEGVIDKDEYEAAVKKISEKPSEPVVVQQPNSGQWKNLVIVGLIIAIAALGLWSFDTQSSLRAMLNQANRDRDTYKEQAYSLYNCESALNNFYLDQAVIVVENGDGHYHRYNCPNLPAYYNFWVFNPEFAQDRGYTKCPLCFGENASSYDNKYIKK